MHPVRRRWLAEELVRRRSPDEERRYAASQRAGRIDPNPHQIDAVIFALSRIPEGGCILADEVGLGKTIEAGLVIAQMRAEGAKKILLVTPKPLLGAPCSLDVPCLVGQCIDGACSRPTAGFACGPSSLLFPGIGCLDSYCESGMCHEYQVLGGACVEQSTCGPSRVCSGGVCVDRRGLGEPCVREGDGPPCANTFECVGANGAQTCQLCD